ncbi:transcription initiation protein [Nonomuraea sp. NN258]|uniref:YciI family protein n=1 Tax=Nonomuraea antri TaxID=2730852 RepID=UPI00156A41B6|nr:YciI family protein [Nonomuraea antri]NRQ36150.1 transcription initiation protein [Nonomuraea antri]
MKYVLFAIGDERPWAQAGPEERQAVYEKWGAFERLLGRRGAALGGAELAHSSTATTIRKDGGRILVTDGPYAETVEQISGYLMVEAASLADAVELATAMPSGGVEIRPVSEEVAP